MKSLAFSLNIQDLGELITALRSLNIREKDIYVVAPDDIIKNEKNRKLGRVKIIPLRSTIPEIIVYSKAVAESLWNFSQDNNVEIMLFAADRLGKEIAAYIAQFAEVDHLSEAQKLYWTDEGYLGGERNILSGKVIVEEVLTRKPYVATIMPRSYSSAEFKDEAIVSGEIYIDINKYNKLKILKAESARKESIDIESAKIIVSVGRGFKKKEDLKLAFDLAKLLGAEIGCSRPIAADLKWLSEDHWVGLSGHKVKPDLYMAIGISGQSQHIAGMKDSKLVAAINIDKGAPIFSNADYGIVGDLYKVVPLLIKELKRRKSTS